MERLIAAAEEMKQSTPSSSPGSVTPLPCNIRNENEVGLFFMSGFEYTANIPPNSVAPLSVRQVKALVSTVLKRFGRIDFLVNNGGGQFSSPAENMSSKGWTAVVDTNLTGTFHCCKEGELQQATVVCSAFTPLSDCVCAPHSVHLVDETAWRCDCQHYR